MNFYHFVRSKIRRIVILLWGIAFTVALLLGRGQEFSWAAPAQNPQMQTVPPRITETPVPPTPVSASPNPAAPTSRPTTTSSGKNNNGQEDEATLLPTRISGGGETGQIESIEPEVKIENLPAKVSQPAGATPTQGNSPGQTNAPGNKKDNEAFITPQHADLSLSKWVNNTTPPVGETITLTTIINNSGPSRATNVVIRTPLPPGLVFSSVLADRGIYDPGEGLWVINTIARSEQVTMSLMVKVTEVDPLTIATEIVAVDQFDPDSTPHNNLTLEDDWASVSLTPLQGTLWGTQNRNDPVDPGAISLPAPETSSLSYRSSIFFWLFGLIGGITFVFMGIQLVRRS